MRTRNCEDLSFEEVKQIILDSFKVLFARYKLGDDVVDIVNLTKDGVERSSDSVKVVFDYNDFVNKEDIL